MDEIFNVNNYKIDKEHDEIFKLFHKLNELCVKHTIEEEKLINIRNNIKPKNHINIDEEIKYHILDHKNLLNKINLLKEEFMNHIKRKDILHFHKL